jgi:S-adenosylmethionine synthetase
MLCSELNPTSTKSAISVAALWHRCGSERFTKYEMAKIMAELLGRPTARLHADPNPPKGAPRPRDCRLDSSALERLCTGRRTVFRTAMAEILRGSAGSAQA